MSAGGSTRAILAALLANLGIAIAKFVGFLITGAASLLAEAVHSLADTTNQALLLLGGKRARQDADQEHPFGYGRERYFYAFVVAVVIFSLGSLFSLFEGYEKLHAALGGDAEELSSPLVGIVILVVAMGLEGFSFRTAMVESNHVRGEQSWVQFIRRTKTPELPVVLLEDFGALVGLALALAGVGLTLLTGDLVWDAIGTLSIGVLLGAIAVVLIIETKSLLIGEGVGPRDLETIREALVGTPGVSRLIHLRTQYLGPDELIVAAKLEFGAASVAEVADVIDAAEQRLRSALPAARIIYLEPDLYEASQA